MSLRFFSLLSFDNADKTRLHEAPCKCRRIHQYEKVEFISILSSSGRDESELERKDGTRRHRPAKLKQARLRVPLELILTPTRCIDDCVHVGGVCNESRQSSVTK